MSDLRDRAFMSPEGDPREASFLAEASRLLADSLDYETTLSTVAELALPHLGAWCIVDIVEESGEIRRLAIVHPQPAKQELARELRDGWPPDRGDPLGVPVVARTRSSQIVTHVDDALLERVARSERNLEILKQLGIGSVMMVPLAARGDVLGAITFVGPSAGHHYTADDLALAEDLANRAAIAIDNARLYTQAQQAREAAEVASRAKSQFLGIMSHELRTPINAILGYAQILDMGMKGTLTTEQRELLGRIVVSSKDLLGLVTRVLDVSKAESGQLTVHNQVTVVDHVIQSALKNVADRTEGIHVENRCDGANRIRFLGDGIRAREILTHLLNNALRFTPDGGHVTVRCKHIEEAPDVPALDGRGPWVRIDIEDTGIGISKEKLEAVFEPFVQADTARFTREVDGSGLGLAISRYLARLMGGEITVSSEPGIGSSFSLWLPAPRKMAAARRDRRLFDREAAGLSLLSDHVLSRLKPITETYVQRLIQDGSVPRASETSEIELRDHVPHFLSGLASLLAHTGEAEGGISEVLQAGHEIQRMVLELHGTQRYHLGWTEEALRRDLDILKATVQDDLRSCTPHGTRLGESFRVLDRLFEQAVHISLQGWHRSRDDGPTSGSDSRRPKRVRKRSA